MAYVTQSATVSLSASGDSTVVAGVTGKRIVVMSYLVSNGAGSAQEVTWKSGSTVLSGAMSLASSVGGTLGLAAGSSEAPLLVTAPGEALVLNLSAATAVGGHVGFYYR